LAERAALVTGGSSGIGLAIARALGEDGYALTVSARRPEKLEEAVEGLRADGLDVLSVPANMAQEEEVVGLVAKHKEAHGRLDVLVNNAGIGIGQPMGEIQTKHLDLQLDVNLRAVIIGTREALPMLKEAGAEHGKALIVNTASIAGKIGTPWTSVYGATKAAVINYSIATQKEVGLEGIQCTALAPAFVDTPMTDYAKEQVAAEEMIRPEDIAEAVRFLLRLSRNCVVPEIVFMRPSDAAQGTLT
jgi:NAD(P)-dependent dehydrogenase (short-subunit alcohol dehydrogenase family)